MSVSPSAYAELNSWIEQRLAADGTPGLSLAITDRTGVIHTAAFGLAQIESNLPMAPSHYLESGSIGKSFTAIAILQLADEGELDIHAPITDYLPWFEIQSEFEPITLHHLLSHTAGITSALDFAPAGAIQVWLLRDSRTSTPPGTYFHYSNIGYKVVGEVLARVTGQTYGETIRQRILDPLGMRDSVPTITHDVRSKLAVGYGPLFDDRPWWPGLPLAPATWLETDTADGCLAMTASDLAEYLRMLLNRGRAPSGQALLSERAYERLTQRVIQIADEPEPIWYGYGINSRVVDGHLYIGHTGGMVGYFSGMIGDMETGMGVTTLVNGPGAPNFIARTTLDYLRAMSEGRPFTFPSHEDPNHIPNGTDYAGTYRQHSSQIEVIANDASLTLLADGKASPLRSFGTDAFVTTHPNFELVPLTFVREKGRVVACAHGHDYYTPPDVAEPEWPAVPEAWFAYPGHYRSHNPWTTGFRIVLGQGRLWLILPSEPDGLDGQQPLVALDDGSFRCGEDIRIPEWIRFDAIVEGKAQRANLSGCDFYRVNQA